MAIEMLTIQGNLTADPQILKSKDGREFAKYTVAVNDSQERTTFYDCYSNNVNYIKKAYQKGTRVCVTGTPRFVVNEGQDGKTYSSIELHGAQEKSFIIEQGRAVADADYKQFGEAGKATFSLAVRRDYQSNGEYKTDFIDVTAWRGLAEFSKNHVKKGASFVVIGTLEDNSYQNKEGQTVKRLHINADSIQFGQNKTMTQTVAPKKEEAPEEEETLPWEQGPTM